MINKIKEITVPEFAEKIGMSRETVSRWVRDGKIKGFKKDPFQAKTAPVFIPIGELERVLKLMEQNQNEPN
jgi:transposase